MTTVSQIGLAGLGSGVALNRSASHPQPAAEAPVDRVELSPQSAVDERAEAARIAHIRAQIADGTYLTEDKLAHVVERLYSELRRAR